MENERRGKDENLRGEEEVVGEAKEGSQVASSSPMAEVGAE